MKNINTNIEKQNNLRFLELDRILETQLPPFCMEFFIGISMNTAILTRLNYARDLTIFFDFLVTKVNSFYGKPVRSILIDDLNLIETKDIEYFLHYLSFYIHNGKQRKNTNIGKARKLSSIKSMFKYFYKNNKLQENITTKVNTPKISEKPIIRLNSEEVETIFDLTESNNTFESEFQNNYNRNTTTRDKALFALLLGTGIRVSECVNLNLNDFDFSNNSFLVTRKGGNVSILYYSDEVKAYLKEYLLFRQERLMKADLFNEVNAFFISLQNKRISTRAVENIVKKYTKLVNPLKNISPHKLRSTYGTELYIQTKDIYVVAEVLGHKDVNTTKKHYTATSDDIKKDAANVVVLRKKN